MKLIRQGVFKTNSSSCHSMAYVARLQLNTPQETETITQQFGVLGFTPMFNDQSWEVTFNGKTNEYYVDEYHKKSNTVITLSED